MTKHSCDILLFLHWLLHAIWNSFPSMVASRPPAPRQQNQTATLPPPCCTVGGGKLWLVHLQTSTFVSSAQEILQFTNFFPATVKNQRRETSWHFSMCACAFGVKSCNPQSQTHGAVSSCFAHITEGSQALTHCTSHGSMRSGHSLHEEGEIRSFPQREAQKSGPSFFKFL